MGKKKSKTASPLGFEVLLPVGQEKGQIGTSLPTPGTYWKGHVPEDKDKVFLCHVVEYSALHDFTGPGGVVERRGQAFKMEERGEDGKSGSRDTFWMGYPKPYMQYKTH